MAVSGPLWRLQVDRRLDQQVRTVSELAQACVATRAEKPSKLAGVVVMIDVEAVRPVILAPFLWV